MQEAALSSNTDKQGIKSAPVFAYLGYRPRDPESVVLFRYLRGKSLAPGQKIGPGQTIMIIPHDGMFFHVTPK